MVSCQVIVFGSSVAIGLLLIIIGGSVLGVLPKITKDKIAEQLVLKNGTEAGDRFIKSPVASYMSFYMFNVTNKDEAMTGKKPVLEEKGPYVFRQEKKKQILSWNDQEGTVKYKEPADYEFQPEMSKGSLDDVINHVNAVVIGLRYTKIIPESHLETLKADYIVTHTVKELLFDGYRFDEFLPTDFAALCLGAPPLCTFGFYYGKSGPLDPPKENEVRTGAKDINTIGQYVSYNRGEKLNYWYGDSCNALNGTDGKQFAPWLDTTENKNLYVFSSDICRSMMFEYEKDVVVEEIDTYRYVVPPIVFSDPNQYEPNMCFCPRKDDKEPCPSKAGVFSIASCQSNKPVAISAPHFYMGEKEYREKFEGLNPEKEKHQTFLDVEQLTGTVISAAKRIQINIIVEPYKPLKMLDHVKEGFYFPALWLEEGGRIDKKNAEDFRKKVTSPYKSAKWGLVSMIAIGAVVVLLATAIGCFKKSR